MKTLTRLGCKSCILAALWGCGTDPITLGELIHAANADDGATRDDDPTLPPSIEEEAAPETQTESMIQEAQAAPDTSNPVERQVLEILRVNCEACHIGETPFGNFSVYDDVDLMIENDLIIPGDRADSRLYTRMESQTMPPAYVQEPRPTLGQIELVGLFIDSLE